MAADSVIIVTGGAGFIGSAFVRQAVRRGMRVAVLDKLTYAGDLARLDEVKGAFEFHQADIADYTAVSAVIGKLRPSAIVHFAAETHVDRSIVDPGAFYQTNVTGTLNLIDSAMKAGVGRFVHISTDEVYGDLPDDKDALFTEGDPLQPNSPYAASKASADMIVRAYARTYGYKALTVRPSNNYGPWQYPEKLIPLSILRVLTGGKIPVYGRGENIRTWLHVEDCARGILAVFDKGAPGEAYNIGTSDERVNIDVVRTILKALGKGEDSMEFVPDRPGHDFRYALRTDKVRSATGWAPDVRFEQGLQETVRWCLDHQKWLIEKRAEAEAFVKGCLAGYGRKQ